MSLKEWKNDEINTQVDEEMGVSQGNRRKRSPKLSDS